MCLAGMSVGAHVEMEVEVEVQASSGYLSPIFALSVLLPDALVNQHKEQTAPHPMSAAFCPHSSSSTTSTSPFPGISSVLHPPGGIVIHHRPT